jgi:putative transposase
MLCGSTSEHPAAASVTAIEKTGVRDDFLSGMSSFYPLARFVHMSRPNRNFAPGFPAHVVHRGNDRQDIFKCTGDYLFLRKCLEETASAQGVEVHSYVLMTNHLHLLLTPKDSLAISKLMHSVMRRYVGYFNARYKRTGTLWEGRFHTTTIGSDFYLLACHRYIDNNPVRAGLVPRPEEYPWSSHRYYALDDPDSLVTPHQTVIALGADDAARRRASSF